MIWRGDANGQENQDEHEDDAVVVDIAIAIAISQRIIFGKMK